MRTRAAHLVRTGAGRPAAAVDRVAAVCAEPRPAEPARVLALLAGDPAGHRPAQAPDRRVARRPGLRRRPDDLRRQSARQGARLLVAGTGRRRRVRPDRRRRATSSSAACSDVPKRTSSPDSSDWISAIAIMAGFERSNNSQNFRGGDLTAVMGGCEIDLRQANLRAPASIDVFVDVGRHRGARAGGLDRRAARHAAAGRLRRQDPPASRRRPRSASSSAVSR